MTKLMECADAVTAVLNSTTWTSPAWGTIKAERRWAPKHRLEQLQATKCFVMPRETGLHDHTRGDDEERLTVVVLVAMKPNQFENEDIDPAMVLMSEMRSHFFAQPLTGVEGVNCVEANIVGPDGEQLENHRQFVAMLALVFQGFTP